MAPPDDPVLEQIVGRITSDLPVQKIILFGSRAHGDARSDSDYDLAVVWDTPMPPLFRALAVRKRLRGLGIPVDLVMFTPFEYEHGGDVRYVVWQDVLEHGTTVYDADALAA